MNVIPEASGRVIPSSPETNFKCNPIQFQTVNRLPAAGFEEA